MKYRFILLVVIISCTYITTFSQSNITSSLQKLKECYQNNATTTGSKDVYLNRSANLLQLGKSQIPVFNVRVRYLYTNSHNCVLFQCPTSEGDCIISLSTNQEEDYYNMVATPFKSKEACYKFLDLFADLKSHLKTTE